MASNDLDTTLKAVADDRGVAILSFIAPNPVKVSPARTNYTSISEADIYNLEDQVESATESNKELPDTLHLIIHTPGGDLYSTTKIVTFLRDRFKKIVAFVPYEAASGGTVLCYAADEIVMSSFANLTPTDPQIFYKNQYVSVTSFAAAVETFEKKFETIAEPEVPTPYSQMASMFDPIILKEMDKKSVDAFRTLAQLGSRTTQFDNNPYKSGQVAFRLTYPDFPHNHVIGREEAGELGFRVADESAHGDLLKTYRKFVRAKLKERTSNHVIKMYIPAERIRGDQNATSDNVVSIKKEAELA